MVKKFNNDGAKKFYLLLPYILITLVLVIVPLVLIFLRSFMSATDSVTGDHLPVKDNWNFLGKNTFEKIGLSLMVAVACTIFCLIIGYMFAYFLSLSKSLPLKILAISLITSPMWISMLVKIVGLKTLFDFINGSPNSTYGSIYTIIALTYINLPVFILTIYTYLNSIPKNLLQASKDLGKNSLQTFCFVVVPYTKNAIFSGMALVFLPSLTTAGVTQFVDNSNNGSTIGGDLMNQGLEATASEIALSRVASLSLVICLLILLLWTFFVLLPKTIKIIKNNKNKRGNSQCIV